MKKNTLVLALVFAAIFSYVWLVERKQPAKLNSSHQDTFKVFQFPAGEIQGIVITRDGFTLELARAGSSQWEIKKPLEDWGDLEACNGLAETIANLTTLDTIPKDENLQAYGFGTHAAKLTISTKNRNANEIRIGNQDPTRSGTYLLLPADKKLVLIPLALKQLVTRPLDDWRDHALLHFSQNKVNKISVVTKKQSFSLSLGTVRGTGPEWGLSPTKAKVDPQKIDSQKVQQLLSSLAYARAIGFSSANNAAGAKLLSISLWEQGTTQPKVLNAYSTKSKMFLVENPERKITLVVPQNFLGTIDLKPSWFEQHAPRNAPKGAP